MDPSLMACVDNKQGQSFGWAILKTAKLRFSLTTTILIYVVYLLPFCFGVFGNISVCLIFFKQRKLRSITNTFLMNLCINDLIVLCVSIPMTLSATLLQHWVFGTFLCKLVNFTPTLTALVSTFTVAVIAVERWLFIVNKQRFHRNCTIFILVLLWCVSIFIALPEFFSREVQESVSPNILPYVLNNYSTLPGSSTGNHTLIPMDYYKIKQPCQQEKVYYCVLEPDLNMRIFSYFIMTVQYVVPFLFVSVSCYSISRYLKKRMKRMSAYEIRHRRTLASTPSIVQQEVLPTLNEFTENELVNGNCTSITFVSSDNASHNVLSRTQRTSHNRDSTQCRSSVSFAEPSSISHQPQATSVSQAQSHTKRRFHRSRKLLICIAALFTVSWLPLTIVQIYLEHNGEVLYTRDGANFVYGFLLIPCYLVSSLSAWINPVIYNYINRSFRREFYRLYSCFYKVSSLKHRQSVTTNLPKGNRQDRMRGEESCVSLV